jgi:type VI secretion system secreted protein Hcp
MRFDTVISRAALAALTALTCALIPPVASAQARAAPQREALQRAQARPSQSQIAAPTRAARAIDGYIKIGDIKGESTDRSHKNWIEIESWNFAGSRASALRNPPSNRGPGSVTLVLHSDKASPKLSAACTSGRSLGRVVLHVRAAGGSDRYDEYVLDETNATSCGQSSPGDRPSESITLNFGKVEGTMPGGDPGRPIVTGR